jgi:hypothetical protein
MTTVRKTGIGPFGRTIVTIGNTEHAFRKSSEVSVSRSGVCVTEQRLFSKETTCFSNGSAQATGSAKSIEVTRSDGETRRYDSGILGVNRLEQVDGEVQVVQRTLTGERVIDRMPASSVVAVKAEDCKVCREVNPLYGVSK